MPRQTNVDETPVPLFKQWPLFTGNVKFIDYEYAGYNYQAYDIGNHFNEFAGNAPTLESRDGYRHLPLDTIHIIVHR